MRKLVRRNSLLFPKPPGEVRAAASRRSGQIRDIERFGEVFETVLMHLAVKPVGFPLLSPIRVGEERHQKPVGRGTRVVPGDQLPATAHPQDFPGGGNCPGIGGEIVDHTAPPTAFPRQPHRLGTVKTHVEKLPPTGVVRQEITVVFRSDQQHGPPRRNRILQFAEAEPAIPASVYCQMTMSWRPRLIPSQE